MCLLSPIQYFQSLFCNPIFSGYIFSVFPCLRVLSKPDVFIGLTWGVSMFRELCFSRKPFLDVFVGDEIRGFSFSNLNFSVGIIHGCR